MMFIRRGQTMCYANGMLSSIFLSYALLLCFSHPFCCARDTITKDDPIKDDGSAGLVSAGGKFELGFFSLIAIGRYVGIWYHQPTPMTLVWVANRDNPLLANQTGVLAINRGTLQLRAAVAYLLSDFSDSYLKKGSGRIFQHNDSSYKQIAVLPRSEYNSTRLVMDYTGKLNWLVHKHNYWSPTWLEPIDNCSVYNPCGYFGSSCNSTNSPICKCLHGFKPQLPNKWDLGDFSGGCIRESNLCATTATNDTFFSLKVKKVQKPDSETSAANETECRNKCLNDCKCVAYSYVDSEIRNRATTRSCFTWASELSNLEEDSGGQDLYARIAMPDLASVEREQM